MLRPTARRLHARAAQAVLPAADAAHMLESLQELAATWLRKALRTVLNSVLSDTVSALQGKRFVPPCTGAHHTPCARCAALRSRHAPPAPSPSHMIGHGD